MTEGRVEIFLSYKEPNYRDNLLWLRPYLDREGYELLYYGPYGWKPLINGCKCNEENTPDTPIIPPIDDDSECREL